MHLTFTTLSGELTALELSDDMELDNVKALCSMDLRIPAEHMRLSVDGKVVAEDERTLSACGLKNGDMILVEDSRRQTSAAPSSATRPLSSSAENPSAKKIPKIDFSSIVVPGASGSRQAPTNAVGLPAPVMQKAMAVSAGIKEMSVKDPRLFGEERSKRPELFDAAMRDDHRKVAEIIQAEQAEAHRKLQMLYSNPDSHEAQQLIEEAIRKQRIQENLEYAMEHTPEALASVHMLYVNCTLNGKKMKAFVDSGAQISIISREYAEQCHIAHLIDDRWQGMAVGVGSQRFTGRIHACQLEIGGAFLATTFNVLDQNNMQVLLGLDMLRRHQMVIDLKRNVLVIGTTGAETPFLHESEIPGGRSGSEEAYVPNETDIQDLINMGFSREKAQNALKETFGDKDAAASKLLAENSRGSSRS